jgi:multidrug efflux pump subunit AcrA (membrane-fusion protein)
MKKIVIAALVLVIIGTVGYFIYTNWMYLTNNKEIKEAKKNNSDIAYYHCGMHTWIKSDKPGACPICGMNLTPVYKGGAKSEKGVVQIDPAVVQNIGVKMEKIMKRKLTHTIRTTGKVDYNEKTQFYITTKFSGYIEKLYVDYTGKPVQKGEPLFEIYSPELVAAQQEYLQALRYSKIMNASNDISGGGNELLQSARKKLSYWDISSGQINTLEQNGNIKKSLIIYSPFSGIVIEKSITAGMQVQAGMNLLKLAELSLIWIFADVYEDDLPWVKTGEIASIESPDAPGSSLTGTVSYIYPFVDEQTRTVKVRIELPNPDMSLKKDMYVKVNIKSTVSLEAIAVPEQAVIHSGKRDIVVMAMGEGKFMPMEVKLGILADGYYQVLEGLKEGDLIVTSSQFLIDSESNLKAVVSGMNGMPGMDMKGKKGEDMKGMKMK